MKVRLLLASLFFSVLICSAQQPALVPMPAEIRMDGGNFTLSAATPLVAQGAEEGRIARMFNDYIELHYGFRLKEVKEATGAQVSFVTRKFIRKPDRETYDLTIGSEGVRIEADSYEQLFYGLQTLLQIVPESGETDAEAAGKKRRRSGETVALPWLTIHDFPRFGYRGMHLDVCRHFFPVSFVKKYIDLLAAHKLNTFHWHLTDDQGWRIEIKKYPELTSKGGWRNGTIIGRYPGTGNDNIRYGGFYTQGEVREIVKYAADRFITVIPEIEMPGHASAAIAAYPYLSCFPDTATVIPSWPSAVSRAAQADRKPKQVQETWGVFDDVFCAGKETTFDLLDGVLDEVIALFPGTYVHIGGDECPKTNWKKCPACQARMKAEGLKDEHELQSYFIRRIERHVNEKGRQIIGWDEILEGGLAPNAAVMSWRGERGGVEAAQQKHAVVMTPQKPLYFDHTQSKSEDSLVIGGYNPLDSVYAYDPLPAGLDTASAKYILGGQANVWTEYMAYPSKVEYMVLPRMAALSEVLWTPQSNRNWESFEDRLPALFTRYDRMGFNASRAHYQLRVSVFPYGNNGTIGISLNTKLPGARILLDTLPHEYLYDVYQDDTLKFRTTEHLMFILMDDKSRRFQELYTDIEFSKSTGHLVTLKTPASRNWPGLGAFSLVNGNWSKKGLANPDWLGFLGNDMDASIDLGYRKPFSSVSLHTIDQNGSWIYLPQSVEVFVSDDGQNFHSVGQSSSFTKEDPDYTHGWITVKVPETSARFVRVLAKNYGLIPDGKPGAGTRAWLFADEISIE